MRLARSTGTPVETNPAALKPLRTAIEVRPLDPSSVSFSQPELDWLARACGRFSSSTLRGRDHQRRTAPPSSVTQYLSFCSCLLLRLPLLCLCDNQALRMTNGQLCTRR